jgi:hypothetical protein
MKRLLRWGGLAISIGTYVALTIWANTSAGETALVRGEPATRAEMQPFWMLIYAGVLMFGASFLIRKRGKDHSVAAETNWPEKNSKQSATFADGSERLFSAVSSGELRRAAANLREEALTGNLRPRKQPDPTEENPDK